MKIHFKRAIAAHKLLHGPDWPKHPLTVSVPFLPEKCPICGSTPVWEVSCHCGVLYVGLVTEDAVEMAKSGLTHPLPLVPHRGIPSDSSQA